MRTPSITRWSLRHGRLVVVLWIVATVAGLAATSTLGGALSKQFALPGQEGYEVNQAILQRYGSGGRIAPLAAVVSLPAGRTVRSPGVRSELGQAFARIGAAVPGARTVSYASSGSRAFVSADGRTTFALVFPQPDPKEDSGNSAALADARRAARDVRVAGTTVRISGVDALRSHGGGDSGPGTALEALLGAAGALLVLAFVFGSPLALLPVLMALPAIMATFLLVRGLTTFTDVSYIVQYLVALVGLGIAIDYALLVSARWREERASGAVSNEAAVERAMATAGRAVITSGVTVAIGLLALVVLPIPFLRSVGYAGLLIPLVSVLVALTLLPVLLASIGPALDRRRWRARAGAEAAAGRRWRAFAGWVLRRRVPAALAGTAVLVALLAAATTLNLGEPRATALAQTGQARAGLDALRSAGVGAGSLEPIEVLAPAARAEALAARLGGVDGVRGAVAPHGPAWRRGGKALVEVLPSAGDGTAAAGAVLDRTRAVAHRAGARVGGPQAQMDDFVSTAYGSFLPMLALIAALTFALLARAFRSVLLPLKAIALNVLSVGAAWGVIALVWQHGHGSQAIWGIPATGATTAWVPLIVFAFLYGLSMDYEVFILSRIREERDRGATTDAAVVSGLGRIGRLVTSAALILFLAFAALASAPVTDIKLLATGLAAGILIDATVVRSLLLPALVSLLGRANWWLPSFAHAMAATGGPGAPVEPIAEVKPPVAAAEPQPIRQPTRRQGEA